MTQQEEAQISAVVAKAVAETIAKSNGNGKRIPKTLMEFVWMAAQTFGVPVAIVGVCLALGYQIIPRIVNATIETQQSLMKNLESQTENIERQTENIKAQATALSAIGQTVEEIKECEVQLEEFQVNVTVEHDEMIKTLRDTSIFTAEASEHWDRQAEQTDAMVQTLEDISTKLTN